MRDVVQPPLSSALMSTDAMMNIFAGTSKTHFAYATTATTLGLTGIKNTLGSGLNLNIPKGRRTYKKHTLA